MPERILVPSIESRLAALIEIARRSGKGSGSESPKPTITLSREFGCEAYPVAEQLKEVLERKTGEKWGLADRALLDEVARDNSISDEILKSLGTRPRFLDALLSTLTPSWRSEKDYYRLLCDYIVAAAAKGNIIIVGMGGAILTQDLPNCRHFRLYASEHFKISSICRRMKVGTAEAVEIIERKQAQRNRFIRDFLDRDARDLSFYHLVINNDKNGTERIVETILRYVQEF